MEVAMTLREIEIKVLDRPLPTVDLQRAVYVGAALLLATFMLAFATAPRARPPTTAPTTGALIGNILPQPLLPTWRP